MTKEELKKQITDLHLDAELRDLLFTLIDGAPQVNETLMKTIADILEMQAGLDGMEADIVDQEAVMQQQKLPPEETAQQPTK